MFSKRQPKHEIHDDCRADVGERRDAPISVEHAACGFGWPSVSGLYDRNFLYGNQFANAQGRADAATIVKQILRELPSALAVIAFVVTTSLLLAALS